MPEQFVDPIVKWGQVLLVALGLTMIATFLSIPFRLLTEWLIHKWKDKRNG